MQPLLISMYTKQPRSWSPCEVNWKPSVKHDTTVKLQFSKPGAKCCSPTIVSTENNTLHCEHTSEQTTRFCYDLHNKERCRSTTQHGFCRHNKLWPAGKDCTASSAPPHTFCSPAASGWWFTPFLSLCLNKINEPTFVKMPTKYWIASWYELHYFRGEPYSITLWSD